MKLLNRILFGLDIVFGLMVILVVCLAMDIGRWAVITDPEPADVALVLGAAVMDDAPSPVFAERLRYAAALYSAGTVKKIIVSGGLAVGDEKTEADAGRDWIAAHGVPVADIIIEPKARTTQQNLALSLPILKDNGFETVLIVSDPMHIRRAMTMAGYLGIDARPAPTPTSRYVSPETKFEFLLREIWFNIVYTFTGQ